MRLYVDDDSASGLLIRLLHDVGHDVKTPADAGLAGEDDPVHLTYAVEEGRVFLSGNHDDFRKLHNLIVRTGGVHPGMLIVRRDNNPRRDMSARAIVQSIGNLLASNTSIENQFIILNHRR